MIMNKDKHKKKRMKRLK